MGQHSRFSVDVRCRTCWQVVPAVPEPKGFFMWQHKLPGGADCPAWKVGTDHEPVDAQEKREKLERGRLARVAMPRAGGCHHSSPTPHWIRGERYTEYFDEKHGEGMDAEYSGDYLDRRAGGSRI